MWKEDEHSRAEDGKFTAESGEYRQNIGYDEILKKDKEPKKKYKSQDEFFGEEFKGVKGQAALELLLKEKRGHVKGAFKRKEIGSIDLVWGDENGGLLHTIQKRDKLFSKGIGSISGEDMVKKIPEIIENGEFGQDSAGRINIDYGGYRVGIMPKFYDKKINWIVTAMERWK